ncbi:hypothetical protein [Burkholderia sp. Ac-20349]|uniref:hypothetical protein n=1 Tax=Burkholderia sp. Ac-20349 TaxID=2703893 RepID=UPI00197CA7CB|nr:hypothetical protein [Burkholderia sp. Ac-20349]MBN3838555.1 hypothetical protein [Burkholderia sp. Ac-20349]
MQKNREGFTAFAGCVLSGERAGSTDSTDLQPSSSHRRTKSDVSRMSVFSVEMFTLPLLPDVTSCRVGAA